MSTTENPEQNEGVRRLQGWDAGAIGEVLRFREELTLVIPREKLRRVCEWLCGEAGIEFTFLTDVTGGSQWSRGLN
jgi:hypothetical protein